MEFYYNETENDVLIVKADGGLNRQTAAEFVDSLTRLIDAGLKKIIVDCSALDYVSSYGLGILIRLHARLKKRGGDVKLSCVRGALPQLLSITRLDQVFDIYSDVNRARLAFRPQDDSDHPG